MRHHDADHALGVRHGEHVQQEGQIAFAHCERMQWVGGRWMVAPGAPPAPAPATWPGTQLAHEAGWRTWSTDDTTDPDHIEGDH
mgnify:CR=1 FL=1